MRWDRHSWTAFAGIAALVIGGVMPFAEASSAFTPVIGMVGGIAAVALANHEQLKLRIQLPGKAAGAGGESQ
jgi:hypothetical protein